MPVESDADILGMFDAADFGVAATWAPAWSRDWPRTLVADLVADTYTLSVDTTALAVIQDDPSDATPAFGGGLGAIAQGRTIMLPAAALPAEPLRDDLMTVAGTDCRIEAATSDVDRRLWRATLGKP
jgi:hypothetical protein